MPNFLNFGQEAVIFTGSQQSGEGNVFSRVCVCHSVCSRGGGSTVQGPSISVHWPQPCSPWIHVNLLNLIFTVQGPVSQTCSNLIYLDITTQAPASPVPNPPTPPFVYVLTFIVKHGLSEGGLRLKCLLVSDCILHTMKYKVNYTGSKWRILLGYILLQASTCQCRSSLGYMRESEALIFPQRKN